MSKILIVNSSYRKNSNSTELGLQVAEGALSKGNEITTIDISHDIINACRGCQACVQPNGKNGCIINDAMQQYYPLIQEADTIVFVSPIYWFTLGGQIKQFIDRCFAVATPIPPAVKSPFADKKFAAAFAYGGEDVFISGCVNAIRMLQDTCNYTTATWAGAVYGEAYEEGVIRENKKLLQAAYNLGTTL